MLFRSSFCSPISSLLDLLSHLIIQFCPFSEFFRAEHIIVLESFSAGDVAIYFMLLINCNQAGIFHHENMMGSSVVSSNLPVGVATFPLLKSCLNYVSVLIKSWIYL